MYHKFATLVCFPAILPSILPAWDCVKHGLEDRIPLVMPGVLYIEQLVGAPGLSVCQSGVEEELSHSVLEVATSPSLQQERSSS